jgi:hypothetical protein
MKTKRRESCIRAVDLKRRASIFCASCRKYGSVINLGFFLHFLGAFLVASSPFFLIYQKRSSEGHCNWIEMNKNDRYNWNITYSGLGSSNSVMEKTGGNFLVKKTF